MTASMKTNQNTQEVKNERFVIILKKSKTEMTASMKSKHTRG